MITGNKGEWREIYTLLKLIGDKLQTVWQFGCRSCHTGDCIGNTEQNKTNAMITGNKGEWSEIYTLLKLIGDKRVFAGDGKLNKIDNLFYPIVEILRKEQTADCRYLLQETNVVVYKNEKEFCKLKLSCFQEQATHLFLAIQKSSSAFSVPQTENFMHSIGCEKLKAASADKADIRMFIYDLRTQMKPLLGFSIKSRLGDPSTLLNASSATNIRYIISNAHLGGEDIERINSISTKSKIKDRISEIERIGGQLKYADFENAVFENNLILIDSRLPEIVAEILKMYYCEGKISMSEIVAELANRNPLDYNGQLHPFYRYKIGRFLTDVALGMVPATVWNGSYDATGGYLVVKEDGDILCYHIYDRKDFEDYLIENTKLETPSTRKHNFGVIEFAGGKHYFKLNLQIRFVH
jgi:type II restriction enzyme